MYVKESEKECRRKSKDSQAIALLALKIYCIRDPVFAFARAIWYNDTKGCANTNI